MVGRYTRAERAVALLAVVLGVAGCGGRDGSGWRAWQAVVDTVADTIVVRTVAGSVWCDTARLVEELRIGAMEGEDAYLLGAPSSLAVDEEDGLYVLDAQVPVVRVYDGEGQHVRDLGREGDGPGEYRSPDGVAVLPDGRVLVRDPRTVRVNVYAPDGESLGAWDHPNRGDFHTYHRFFVDTAGTSWVTSVAGWGVPPWEWEYLIIGLSSDGAVTDTVHAPRFAFDAAHLKASGSSGSSARRVPFTAEAVWDFSPLGYMVAGVTGRYAIYLFRPGGPVLRIEREAAPVAVQPEESAERKRRITRGLQRQYGDWRWNGPDVPSTKPPWRDLFVDDDGRIWVVPSRPGEAVLSDAEARAIEERTGERPLRYREPPAFDVFDPDGRFLGPVDAPPGLRTGNPHPLVRGDRMWAVIEDDYGVPYVARYRLVIGAHGAPERVPGCEGRVAREPVGGTAMAVTPMRTAGSLERGGARR